MQQVCNRQQCASRMTDSDPPDPPQEQGQQEDDAGGWQPVARSRRRGFGSGNRSTYGHYGPAPVSCGGALQPYAQPQPLVFYSGARPASLVPAAHTAGPHITPFQFPQTGHAPTPFTASRHTTVFQHSAHGVASGPGEPSGVGGWGHAHPSGGQLHQLVNSHHAAHLANIAGTAQPGSTTWLHQQQQQQHPQHGPYVRSAHYAGPQGAGGTSHAISSPQRPRAAAAPAWQQPLPFKKQSWQQQPRGSTDGDAQGPHDPSQTQHTHYTPSSHHRLSEAVSYDTIPCSTAAPSDNGSSACLQRQASFSSDVSGLSYLANQRDLSDNGYLATAMGSGAGGQGSVANASIGRAGSQGPAEQPQQQPQSQQPASSSGQSAAQSQQDARSGGRSGVSSSAASAAGSRRGGSSSSASTRAQQQQQQQRSSAAHMHSRETVRTASSRLREAASDCAADDSACATPRLLASPAAGPPVSPRSSPATPALTDLSLAFGSTSGTGDDGDAGGVITPQQRGVSVTAVTDALSVETAEQPSAVSGPVEPMMEGAVCPVPATGVQVWLVHTHRHTQTHTQTHMTGRGRTRSHPSAQCRTPACMQQRTWLLMLSVAAAAFLHDSRLFPVCVPCTQVMGAHYGDLEPGQVWGVPAPCYVRFTAHGAHLTSAVMTTLPAPIASHHWAAAHHPPAALCAALSPAVSEPLPTHTDHNTAGPSVLQVHDAVAALDASDNGAASVCMPSGSPVCSVADARARVFVASDNGASTGPAMVPAGLSVHAPTPTSKQGVVAQLLGSTESLGSCNGGGGSGMITPAQPTTPSQAAPAWQRPPPPSPMDSVTSADCDSAVTDSATTPVATTTGQPRLVSVSTAPVSSGTSSPSGNKVAPRFTPLSLSITRSGLLLRSPRSQPSLLAGTQSVGRESGTSTPSRFGRGTSTNGSAVTTAPGLPAGSNNTTRSSSTNGAIADAHIAAAALAAQRALRRCTTPNATQRPLATVSRGSSSNGRGGRRLGADVVAVRAASQPVGGVTVAAQPEMSALSADVLITQHTE